MPSGVHTGAGKKCPPGCKCGRHRKRRRPRSTAKKISEGLIKHYKERGYAGAEFGKRCNRCHQYKPVGDDGDFYRKTATKLKSGVLRQYWDSLCKPCRVDYNREKLREKTPEELSEMWREHRHRWIEKYGKEGVRRKEAEKRALMRDKKGLPPSSRPAVFDEDEIKIPLKPLMEFVRGEIEQKGLVPIDVARAAGIDPSHLDRLIAEKEVVKRRNNEPAYKTKIKWRKDGTRVRKLKVTNLATVDKLLIALDAEEMLTILYPED